MEVETIYLYRNKDKNKLKELTDKIDEIINLVKDFHSAFRFQWFKENKAFGWEVQELRLGGMRARLLHCQARLQAYIDGEIDGIEELEATLLRHGSGFGHHYYLYMVSTSEV